MGRHESEEVSIWALTSFRAQQELRLTLRSVSECDVRAAGEAVADSLAFGTWNIGTTFWLKLSQRFLLLRSCNPDRSPNKRGLLHGKSASTHGRRRDGFKSQCHSCSWQIVD